MSINIAVVGPPSQDLDDGLRALTVSSVVVRAPSLGTIADEKAPQPDVVVVDQRRRTDLDPALAALRRAHPETGVVVVASRLDPPLMLEAMRAGVNEWVTDPVSVADLDAAIARVAPTRAAQSGGQVVAFVGAKGGVGTTTLAVNLSTGIARHGSPTLLIDLHPAFGDAAVFLGAEPRFSVIDALENAQRLDEAFLGGLVAHTQAGPDLLASPAHGQAGAVQSAQIRTLLTVAATHYPYVVLDCPRWDTAVLDALESVTTIVMVVDQELATLRSASRMATTLRHRYGRDRVKTVVARYDAAAEIGRADIERVMGDTIDHVLPSDYRLAVEALNTGEPLVLAKSPNKLSTSIDKLVHDLTGVQNAPVSAGSSSRFFGRLTGRG